MRKQPPTDPAQSSYPEALEALSYPKRLEKVAALLVGHVTKAAIEDLDPGGGSKQLADFEILDASRNRIGLLEVTTTTRPDRASLQAQVRKKNWQFPGLMWSWVIFTGTKVGVRHLHKELGPLLRELELAGPPEDLVPEYPGMIGNEKGALPSDLAALGVVEACAYHHHDNQNESWVSVQRREPGGFFSAEHNLTAEIQAELDKPDNQAKLSGDLGRAELFVWLDVGQGALSAITLSEPPWNVDLNKIDRPTLPEGVTAVWAATGLADWPQPAQTLFRYDGSSWSNHGKPLLKD